MPNQPVTASNDAPDPVSRRILLSCSMTSAIDRLTQLEILAQRDKPPAVPEQSESDLQHPLAHPTELLQ
jgi:hypothetical protein